MEETTLIYLTLEQQIIRLESMPMFPLILIFMAQLLLVGAREGLMVHHQIRSLVTESLVFTGAYSQVVITKMHQQLKCTLATVQVPLVTHRISGSQPQQPTKQ